MATDVQCVDSQALRDTFNALSQEMAKARRENREIPEELKARHRELAAHMTGRAKPKPKAEPTGPSPLRLEIVEDPLVLRDLQPAWDDLLERSNCYSPFLTWEWWSPWLADRAAGSRPYFLLARQDTDGAIMAAWPLVAQDQSARRLGFVGASGGPDPAYLYPPADPTRQADAMEVIMGHFSDMSGERSAVLRWDHCSVNHGVGEMIYAGTRHEVHMDIDINRIYVNGPLPTSYDEFVDNVPAKSRRNLLRHQFERLEREWSTPKLSVHRELTPEAEELIRQMAVYNIARRNALNDYSRWNDPRFTRCLATITRNFSDRGWFRLYTIEVGDRLVAAMMGWAYHGTFFAYQIGETQEHPELGLGQCVIAHTIRSCIEEGLGHFEFLGQGHAWKRSYFGKSTPCASVLMGCDHSRYWASLGARSLRHALGRKLREVRQAWARGPRELRTREVHGTPALRDIRVVPNAT